ncbi:MAG: zinc ribbon domain-containing protein [Anaerolineales bacterium]|nr:zinc ribbon domain-containing protein [Anaerolineales bacterium]
MTSNDLRACPHCGQLHPEGTLFCPLTNLSLESGDQLCPNCGSGVPAAASFCPDCGKQIREVSQTVNMTGSSAADTARTASPTIGAPASGPDRTVRPESAGAAFQRVHVDQPGVSANQGDVYATQQFPYAGQPAGYAAPPLEAAPSKAESSLARWMRGQPVWVLAVSGALLVLCSLCAGIGLASNAKALLGIFISPTPTATFTLTPTTTFTSTNIPTSIPSATQTLPPTSTYTPEPSDTPRPTDTVGPTSTPSETAYYWVKIRNNFAALVFAFRNGKQMGRDPIPLGKYIQYKAPAGVHTFCVCAAEFNNCSSTKTVTVDRDLEIVFP